MNRLIKFLFITLTLLVLGFMLIKARAPKAKIDLSKYEASVFSQSGEDGVIQKIFEVIKPTHKYSVEFGAGDGILNSNTRNLIVNHGWSGYFIEGDEGTAKNNLKKNYADYPKALTQNAWVWPGNFEILLEKAGVPRDFDLLSIDIDSNDYYIWKVMHEWRPKVVVIEFNGVFAPPRKAVVEFHPMNYWDYSDYMGASIQSLYDLGKRKGYELVYVMSMGNNLIFVDGKYYSRFGIKDNSPMVMYKPPQYGLKKGSRAPNGRGWPPFESFTVLHKGKVLQPYNRDLTWDRIKIKKKFAEL